MKAFFALTILVLLISSTGAAYAQPAEIIYGLGPEANEAINQPLVKEAPIKILTSWYNGPKDLEWMSKWKNNVIPESYSKGYSLHLIIFSNDKETSFETKYGKVCGRGYPLSDNYIEDVKKMAEIFKGNGTLYVTMFTEFQTYPCQDNQWKGSEIYYKRLKEQYTQASRIIKTINPKAKVSLGWGGWQARYDDVAKGGGRSLFTYFDDILKESDFQSFQSMQSDHNIQDIRSMTQILGKYGPVMLAHYKPDNRSQKTFDHDINELFTTNYINEVTSLGLFAISFMDYTNIAASPATYKTIKDGIKATSNTVDIKTTTIKKVASKESEYTAILYLDHKSSWSIIWDAFMQQIRPVANHP